MHNMCMHNMCMQFFSLHTGYQYQPPTNQGKNIAIIIHPAAEIYTTIKREMGEKIMECSFCYGQNNAYIRPAG